MSISFSDFVVKTQVFLFRQSDSCRINRLSERVFKVYQSRMKSSFVGCVLYCSYFMFWIDVRICTWRVNTLICHNYGKRVQAFDKVPYYRAKISIYILSLDQSLFSNVKIHLFNDTWFILRQNLLADKLINVLFLSSQLQYRLFFS